MVSTVTLVSYAALMVPLLSAIFMFYRIYRTIFPRGDDLTGPDKAGRLHGKRRMLKTSYSLCLVFLVGLVVLSCYGFETGLDHSKQSSGTTMIYETRSVLGYAETIGAASVAIFLPLLIILWNSSRQAVSSTLEELITLCKKLDPSRNFLSQSLSSVLGGTSVYGIANDSARERLRNNIRGAYADFLYLKEIGDQLRGPFSWTILGIGVFFTGLVMANFQSWFSEPLYVYESMVVLNGVALAIFLWLLMLLCIYLLLVQPVVRETAYVDIFDLEGQFAPKERSQMESKGKK
jgi:hypothetical protein